jgi:hypothetical protein
MPEPPWLECVACSLLDSTSIVALSIAERIIGDHALRAIYQSDGSGRTCSDEEILEAQQLLIRRGWALEPVSAAALACLQQVASEWFPGETRVGDRFRRGGQMGDRCNIFKMPGLWGPDVADLAPPGYRAPC